MSTFFLSLSVNFFTFFSITEFRHFRFSLLTKKKQTEQTEYIFSTSLNFLAFSSQTPLRWFEYFSHFIWFYSDYVKSKKKKIRKEMCLSEPRIFCTSDSFSFEIRLISDDFIRLLYDKNRLIQFRL